MDQLDVTSIVTAVNSSATPDDAWRHFAAAPLSERERQVLALFATGAQTGEVADGLHISERSVREYVARAHTKLDARSRSAAIAKAVHAGLIE